MGGDDGVKLTWVGTGNGTCVGAGIGTAVGAGIGTAVGSAVGMEVLSEYRVVTWLEVKAVSCHTRRYAMEPSK